MLICWNMCVLKLFSTILNVWFWHNKLQKYRKFMSEQGAFAFVIVWVWQQGAWKHAPIQFQCLNHIKFGPGLYGYVQLYYYYLFLILFGHAQTFILFVLVFPPHPTT